MFILGLTGSIGMGKSTTAGLFRAAGIRVHDADAVVHALYAGAATPLIEAAFPGTTRDGAVDRPLLGERVLNDSAALKRLETIVHPLVAAARDAFLNAARIAGERIVVLDVPLLFETGGEALVDAVLCVSAAEPVQKARVLARPGMTDARLAAILARQVPDRDKRRGSHFVIDTGRGVPAAEVQVAAVLRSIAAASGRAERPGR